ncbi:MAG: sortase [Eubacterium sp.]|nr:sortase [Eubacterium sp.]
MNSKTEKSKTAPESGKKHSKKSKKKKDRGIIPYITTPLIFCLISLVVVLPMLISFTNIAVKSVHNVQEKIPYGINDAVVHSERFDNKTLEYDVEKIGLCEKVGVLRCERVGIDTEVFFGVNRVSLRNGVGLSAKSKLNNNNSKLDIAGYSSAYFKGLNNVKKGDVIVFETTDKIYEYEVVSNRVELSPEAKYSTGMILSCDKESKAFSAYNEKKRYVVAEIMSMKDKKGE